MSAYDTWLEEPYQRYYEQADEETCPECGHQTLEKDRQDGGVFCNFQDCDYSDGPDWDAIAEAKAEARAEPDYDRF